MIIRLFAIAVVLAGQSLSAAAHITDTPHAHPHIVELAVGRGPAVLALLIIAVALFGLARSYLPGRTRVNAHLRGRR